MKELLFPPKTFNVNLNLAGLEWLKPLFDGINQHLKQMAENQQELAQEMEVTRAQVEKIGTETRTLLDKVAALQDELAKGGPLTDEVKAANEALKAQVAVVDELVPDAGEQPITA